MGNIANLNNIVFKAISISMWIKLNEIPKTENSYIFILNTLIWNDYLQPHLPNREWHLDPGDWNFV